MPRKYHEWGFRFIKCLLVFISFAGLTLKSWAQQVPTTGIGNVAGNMMEPVGLAADFIYVGCFVLGSSFLFASLVKYIEHRRSPLTVPISTVVFLLIAGLFLLALPSAYLLMNKASPYTFMR